MCPCQRCTEARDFFADRGLPAPRTGYALAYRVYKAPALTEFHWALDEFDVAARKNPRITLRARIAPSDALAQDIVAFARARLACHKRIRRSAFCDLPKTISGKIRRVELRRHAQGSVAAGLANASQLRKTDA